MASNKQETRDAAIEATFEMFLYNRPWIMGKDWITRKDTQQSRDLKAATRDGFEAGEVLGRANAIDEFVQMYKALAMAKSITGLGWLEMLDEVAKEMLKEVKDDE